MCEENIDGWYKNYRVYQGSVYRQIDDLHDIDEGCGSCWQGVDISELKDERSDSESDPGYNSDSY